MITFANILATKSAGTFPVGNGETMPLEALLLVSQHGAKSDLDLKYLFQPVLHTQVSSRVAELNKLEPGSVMYYVVTIQHGIRSRPLGPTPIGIDYLNKAKAYTDLESAREAFNNVKQS